MARDMHQRLRDLRVDRGAEDFMEEAGDPNAAPATDATQPRRYCWCGERVTKSSTDGIQCVEHDDWTP